jgi:hypothetical protein
MLVWSCSLANLCRFKWFFYNLFGVISDEIWGMIKTTTLYHLPGYKTLELVVESEPISSSDNYDPTSILGSSNPVMAEEKTHSRAREQRPSRTSVQNVDVDEDGEEEEWHLNVEEDDIQDATDIKRELTMSYHWIGVSTTTMFTTKMALSRR